MAPSISGHGGEFELVEGVPTIDFTLPQGNVLVQVGTETPRAPFQAPADPEHTIPSGSSSSIRHPNDHPTHRIQPPLINMGNYREAKNSFIIHSSVNPTQETMSFVIRHYETPIDGETIELKASNNIDQPAAIEFRFDAEKNFYVAVIVYNFREWQGEGDPDYARIDLETDTGIKDEVARDCYVYIVLAKDEIPQAQNDPTWRNPQAPTHGKNTLRNASLTINVDELDILMGERQEQVVQPPPTLYHALAQQIHNSNLRFDHHIISLSRITEQDPDSSRGVTYTVDSTTLAAVGLTEFPLGLYLFVDPPTVPQALQEQGAQAEQSTQVEPGLVNLNTASKAELVALPGIGTVLAERIITRRAQTPFTTIKEIQQVQGIKAKLFERLQSQITV